MVNPHTIHGSTAGSTTKVMAETSGKATWNLSQFLGLSAEHTSLGKKEICWGQSQNVTNEQGHDEAWQNI